MGNGVIIHCTIMVTYKKPFTLSPKTVKNESLTMANLLMKLRCYSIHIKMFFNNQNTDSISHAIFKFSIHAYIRKNARRSRYHTKLS